jgi:hypothetical protein
MPRFPVQSLLQGLIELVVPCLISETMIAGKTVTGTVPSRRFPITVSSSPLDWSGAEYVPLLVYLRDVALQEMVLDILFIFGSCNNSTANQGTPLG